MAMIYIGESPNNLRPITPDPSAMQWGLQDISASDAGRVQNGGNTMYKMNSHHPTKANKSTGSISRAIISF